jgi:hypothetical protein
MHNKRDLDISTGRTTSFYTQLAPVNASWIEQAVDGVAVTSSTVRTARASAEDSKIVATFIFVPPSRARRTVFYAF